MIDGRFLLATFNLAADVFDLSMLFSLMLLAPNGVLISVKYTIYVDKCLFIRENVWRYGMKNITFAVS